MLPYTRMQPNTTNCVYSENLIQQNTSIHLSVHSHLVGLIDFWVCLHQIFTVNTICCIGLQMVQYILYNIYGLITRPYWKTILVPSAWPRYISWSLNLAPLYIWSAPVL